MGSSWSVRLQPDRDGPSLKTDTTYVYEIASGLRLEFLHDLLERCQPSLQLPAPAFSRHLLENRRRQELAVGALQHGRGFLELPFEALRGRHERGDDAGQRLARHVI